MYQALIIDDEPLACGLVEEYLEPFPQIKVMGHCHDGFAALKACNQHSPDLIFLDVQMPRINGFEFLDLLENPPAVIFTTAFDEYALQAFEKNAIDYLLKPFSQERFEKSVNRFLQQPRAQKQATKQWSQNFSPGQKSQRLIVKDGSQIFIIPHSQLIRLEADGDYCRIISEQGKFMKKKSLSHFEKLLPPDIFVRIHRSHILNVAHLKRIFPYGKNDHQAHLHNGEKIAISRNGFSKLKTLLEM